MIRNLLKDQWLVVKNQQVINDSLIKVSQIGDQTITDLYAPRADFRGALYQLLIGLLQTSFAPQDRKEWLQYWKSPPTSHELEVAFKPFVEAFNLNTASGKPAFMQDLQLNDGVVSPVSSLFIEAPGGNTLKLNQDLFVKRGKLEQISPYWAAIALFTLQINAPSGGQGHRVSLRGGGPLTTLLLPSESREFNTLWHKLWLNVLIQNEIVGLPGNDTLNDLPFIFPWMGEARLSKGKGSETYPEHASPLQVYWSMPRRIRLDWLDDNGVCDVSGELSDSLVKTYRTQNYGINYAGSWTHPLTPYVFERNKEPYSIKAQPGGLGYRHWLELAVVNQEGNKTRASAFVVKKYRESRYKWLERTYKEAGIPFTLEPRLWVFGYDMDNMKACCWYEAIMPVFNLEDDQRDDLQFIAKLMIQAATDVVSTLKSALKIAWFRDPKNDPAAKKFTERAIVIDSNFWSVTEPHFYHLLSQQVAALKDSNKQAVKKYLLEWRYYLRKTVYELFEQYTLSSSNVDGDYQRIIKARDGKGGLSHYLNGSKALKRLAA
ncbi:MAG: type I-E CRISPR-associated protein Cse1/CasA [Proteobacteria bacterium]|nr:MAG: type I-E CRISPR-associated protein Cse1/CasA [Pseudomonadota bacterium]